jgi:hypothetical protein
MYFKIKGLPGAIDKTQPPVPIFFPYKSGDDFAGFFST